MAIDCDVILKWGATPEQLRAVGGALWHWCSRAAEDTGVYQYLDNQALADLIAGRLPASGPAPARLDPRGFHLRVWDETSRDRRATVASLRREIPPQVVADIVVDGKSWKVAD